jgi:hypothetical protein
MSGEKILFVLIAVGMIAVANHAYSRVDYCRSIQQKNLNCVMQF